MNTRLLLAVVLSASSLTAHGGVIPVTDPAVRAGLSPYNWIVTDGSLSSSVGGASLAVQFLGTRRVELRIDSSAFPGTSASSFPIIAWTTNGGALRTHQLVADQTSVVLVEDAADPVIDLFIKGMSPFEDRWTGAIPGNSVKITGFTVADGAATRAVPQPERIWLNLGDSIMAGDAAAYAEGQGRPKREEWAASDDARASYGWLVAKHLGYRESRIAFGGYNWGGGLAKVPDLATVIDRRMTAPAPSVVLVNLGTNGKPTLEQVTAALEMLRRRCGPETKILVMIPVSGAARAEVTSGFAAYQSSARDTRAHLIDLGKITFATADKVHPTAAGHETIFKALLPEVEKALARPARLPEPDAAPLVQPAS